MPEPYNYLGLMGGAGTLDTGGVVDKALFNQAQTGLVNAQTAQSGAQATLLAQEALKAQAATQRQQQMQRDFQILGSNPTPAAYQHFMTLYPEAHEGLSKAWEMLDTQQRQGTLRTVSDVYARLANKDYEGAIAQLQAHMDSANAAGEDTSSYPQLIQMIRSNPQGSLALAGAALNTAVGPDKFAEMFHTLHPTEAVTPKQREYDWRVQQFGKGAADTWLTTEDTKLLPVQAGGQVFAMGPTGTSSAGTPPQPKGGDQPTGVTVTPTGPAIEHAAFAAVPGLKVTSGLRSAEHNAAVGGVANSYHLTDQARDFVPPKGMPMGALAAKLKKALPGFDVLNEGSHIHVEPGPGIARHAGPVTVATAQEAQGLKPGTHYVTPDGRQFVR